MTLLIEEEEVKKILTFENTLEAVEDAFRQYGKGFAGWNSLKHHHFPPPRCEVRVEGKDQIHGSPNVRGVFQSMAYLEETGMVFLRWSFNLQDRSGNIAYLIDARSGEILAVIRAAAHQSYMRTGADGAVGAKYLSREDSKIAGVLGTGSQGRAQLQFLSRVRNIEKAFAYSGRRKDEAYAKEMSRELGIDVIASDGAEEVVRNADILLTATKATMPIVKGDWINKGLHISAVGADCPIKAELDALTLKNADILVIDDYEIAMDTKELRIPMEQGVIGEENIYGTIGEIVGGTKPGRKTPSDVTIYKSVGTTIPYVTINAMIYEKAVEMDLGKQVDKSSLDLIYSIERARG